MPNWLRETLNVTQYFFGGNSTATAWRCITRSGLGSLSPGTFDLILQLASLLVIVALALLWLVIARVSAVNA